jgi:hypothetical protein
LTGRHQVDPLVTERKDLNVGRIQGKKPHVPIVARWKR